MPQSKRSRHHPDRRRRAGLSLLAIVALLAVVAGGIVAVALFGSSDQPSPIPAIASQQPLRLAGIEAPQPVIDLGRVPLDTPVQPAFLLRNVGADRAYFGRPTIEVLEGC